MQKRDEAKNKIWKEIVCFIKSYIEKNGYSPSLSEIGVGVGRSIYVVRRHMHDMRYEGYIDYKDDLPRTVKVLKDVQ